MAGTKIGSMSSSATNSDGGAPVPEAPRHALVAGLGASALVHVGLAMGALTLTAAATHSELLAIMELAPAPAPAPPAPKEVPPPPPIAYAAPKPRAVRKAAPHTPDQAPLAAATSHSKPVAPSEPQAQVAPTDAAPATQPPPVESTRTARSPSVLAQVEPKYPAAARRDRIQGIVRVEVQLDRTGRILALHVRKSIPLLDASALAALRQWRFSPARDARGTAIAAIVIVPVRFVLR
jgi:periplasmic protein TonB